MTLVPFTAAHVLPAAELVVEGVARLRRRVPALPGRLGSTRAHVAKALAGLAERGAGLVALDDDEAGGVPARPGPRRSRRALVLHAGHRPCSPARPGRPSPLAPVRGARRRLGPVRLRGARRRGPCRRPRRPSTPMRAWASAGTSWTSWRTCGRSTAAAAPRRRLDPPCRPGGRPCADGPGRRAAPAPRGVAGLPAPRGPASRSRSIAAASRTPPPPPSSPSARARPWRSCASGRAPRTSR